MSRNVVKVYEGDGYKFEVEDYEGFLFVHIEKWETSLSSFKGTKRDLKSLLKWAEEEDYDGIHAYTQQHEFPDKFGFEFIKSIFTEDYEEWGVYKCHQQQ